MTKRAAAAVSQPIVFRRADAKLLAAFDPESKMCTMNCGPHRDDPRTDKERALLCGDCHVIERTEP